MFFRRESLLKRGNSLLEKLVGESGNSGGAVRKKAAAVFTVLSPKKDQLDDSRGEKRVSVALWGGEKDNSATVMVSF